MNKNLKLAMKFKDQILKKAKIKKGTQADNIKLGNMGSWAMLFGDADWYIPELNLTVHGTCSGHCKGCFNPDDPKKSECYVAKSLVKYTKRNDDGTVGDITKNECSVKLGHAYRTLAMTMWREELLIRLDLQLTRMQKKFKIVRINESGELTKYEDGVFWRELSVRHPETVFYLYTKNYDAIFKLLNNYDIPENLFINISIWHEYGIEEYKKLEKLSDQIRSFATVDEIWNKEKYRKHGIIIDSMCGAYDSKGRMNHEVTCDLCKKCFSKRSRITGCYKH